MLGDKERRAMAARKFKNDEQRKRWNQYNDSYSKKNYKCYALKLNKNNDQDVIKYLENQNESPTQVLRRLVRKELGTGK